jgi:hypothetical protein
LVQIASPEVLFIIPRSASVPHRKLEHTMTDRKPVLPSLQSAANDPIVLDILQTVQLKQAHLATGRQQGVSILVFHRVISSVELRRTLLLIHCFIHFF